MPAGFRPDANPASRHCAKWHVNCTFCRGRRCGETIMETEKQIQGLRHLSIASIVLGLFGGVLYWWAFGMILSLAGLIVGLVDWVSARRRSLDHRLALAGIYVSAATLILDIVLGLLGLQIVPFA